ncbi:hypothetical protein ES703_12141 [subsurface metagenome]
MIRMGFQDCIDTLLCFVELPCVFIKHSQIQQRAHINRRARSNLLVVVDGCFFIPG